MGNAASAIQEQQRQTGKAVAEVRLVCGGLATSIDKLEKSLGENRSSIDGSRRVLEKIIVDSRAESGRQVEGVADRLAGQVSDLNDKVTRLIWVITALVLLGLFALLWSQGAFAQLLHRGG